MESSKLVDLIVKPVDGLAFTGLRRSSSMGSLQVTLVGEGVDGFDTPSVQSSVAVECHDVAGEAYVDASTAAVVAVDSINVQNLATVEGSANLPSLGAWATPLKFPCDIGSTGSWVKSPSRSIISIPLAFSLCWPTTLFKQS